MAKENFHVWCPVMTPAVSFKKASRSHEKHFGGPKQEVGIHFTLTISKTNLQVI